MRLDLFLKISRLVKRRAVARSLCDAGRVAVNGHESKPGKELRQGDVVEILFNAKRVELEVLSLPVSPKNTNMDVPYRIIAEKTIPQENTL